MMIRSPVLRTITFMTRRFFSAELSDKAYLDPHKHIYMNHFPHLVYVEYWPVGQYPETYITQSLSAKTYQPQVEKILIETLNAQYKRQFNISDVLDQNLNKLFKNVLKSQQEPTLFLQNLLEKLAKNIYIKESSWTWVAEQKVRALHGNNLLNRNPDNFRQFLQEYNKLIEQLVYVSNFGLSGKIQQQQTAQQKHLYYQLNTEVQGIEDLKDKSRPENKNFINSLMSWVHSV